MSSVASEVDFVRDLITAVPEVFVLVELPPPDVEVFVVADPPEVVALPPLAVFAEVLPEVALFVVL